MAGSTPPATCCMPGSSPRRSTIWGCCRSPSPGPADPVVREGVEALVRMSSCFAPFTAEESGERLGHRPSVSDAGWPTADPALLERDTATCIVQIDGKLRDRLVVPGDIDETSLRELALAAVTDALAGRSMTKVIVRAPRLVNVVTKR
ncbi:class I tRNA ligase family protein [Nocardia jiangxiensis]|uniref:class I tRNA ligase family protein n=1 Tax=Nocardia jiangxiensis TaxID=282685 RepID=UPI0002DEEF70|nr:class I tRNA ligase family protein [Nocardia jiangxiensis]